jgi:hypothetical protein
MRPLSQGERVSRSRARDSESISDSGARNGLCARLPHQQRTQSCIVHLGHDIPYDGGYDPWHLALYRPVYACDLVLGTQAWKTRTEGSISGTSSLHAALPGALTLFAAVVGAVVVALR